MPVHPRSATFILALVVASALCAAGPAPSFGADVELLPDMSLRMEAARYLANDDDQQIDTWIGGQAGLARFGSTTLQLHADLETILGDERRPFDANQGSYHIEPSARRRFGVWELALFFHHCSRHALDREKVQAVDWNTLGLRAESQLSARWPLRATFSLGHVTLASLIGYRWEATAGLDATLTQQPGAETHLRGQARLVTTEWTERFPRQELVDLRLEAATRWIRDRRLLEVFIAFERRNDVLLVVPDERSRLVGGFRLGIAEKSLSSRGTPPLLPRPPESAPVAEPPVREVPAEAAPQEAPQARPTPEEVPRVEGSRPTEGAHPAQESGTAQKPGETPTEPGRKTDQPSQPQPGPESAPEDGTQRPSTPDADQRPSND
jgi:hypothetical protein